MAPPTSCITAQGAYATEPTADDPYRYQVGFGNRFASDALGNVLPVAQNTPQYNKYGLYTEQITGSTFTAPKGENLQTWFYRILPSVVHDGMIDFTDTSADIKAPKAHVCPTQTAWKPFKLPSGDAKVDWVEGLKAIACNEGLAIHVYLANTSMNEKAICNTDGEMLICPQQGRLDIQTEFGKMMVKVGELCVIPRGMTFKVALPDGPSRGYVLEVFGTRFTLPHRGALGGHSMANERDFEHPIACFDVDFRRWAIVSKVLGKLFVRYQRHTPFDVVAWHGSYVPYKYDMRKFVYVGSISRDHIDPSVFCILTAKSKQPGVPLVDFLCLGKRWDVATNTFRPPYFHRNVANEFWALIYGPVPDESDGILPGGAMFESSFSPHGEGYNCWKAATETDCSGAEEVSKDRLLIMIETLMPLTITNYGMTDCGTRYQRDRKQWNKLPANFMDHLDEINKGRKSAGLPLLKSVERQT